MSPRISVLRHLATVGRIRVDITMNEDDGSTAAQLTRTSARGPDKHFTLFEGELDQVIDALCDALDVLDPEPESPTNERARRA